MNDKERVRQAVLTLREHFDTVQILCSREDNGRDTTFVEQGAGNWFARYGQVCLFKQYAEGRGPEKSENKPEWEQDDE